MKHFVVTLSACALALPLTTRAQHESEPAAPQHDQHHQHTTPGQESRPANEADPHAEHQTLQPVQSQTDPHAGHAMPKQAAPPKAPPPPEAFQGPEHAAETIFDSELFRAERQEELIDEHGGYVTWLFLADRFEHRIQDGRDDYAWDAEGWYGGDHHKLWIKTEGESTLEQSAKQAELQVLYSRAIGPWFNLQGGIRHDFQPNPERTHLVLGMQGLAPYWFEIDGSLFLSDEGDLTARFEAEYDQRITNKLIVQPAVEINLAAQDASELRIGSGLSSIEAQVRLRYEFVPEFAPYVGVTYERTFGDTADFARMAGEDVGTWSAVVGFRSWF